MRNRISNLDKITKILLVILVVAISYFVVFLILRAVLIKQPATMMEMMNQLMTGSSRADVNLISLIIALIIGIIVSSYLFKEETEEAEKKHEIISKLLSEDEKRVLNEIKKAKEITQDSLRFRLNWSKAKISTILTNLDRKGLIQRERIGKTYKVYLQ